MNSLLVEFLLRRDSVGRFRKCHVRVQLAGVVIRHVGGEADAGLLAIAAGVVVLGAHGAADAIEQVLASRQEQLMDLC